MTRFTPLRLQKALPGLVICLGLFAAVENAASGTGLFIDDGVLKMDLIFETRDLCREEDRSRCEDVPAVLIYYADGQEGQEIPVRLKTRGNWRLRRDICSIPPLFIIFPEEESKGTLFAGQDLLPLTTHCKSKHGKYDNYVLKEYLAYRIYNLLSEKSVRVRLAYIHYRKSANSKLSIPHYGFLNEHFLSVAARNGEELWKTEAFDPSRSNPMDMATMELFQYMIGNTDFSAVAQHNIVLLRDPDGLVTPLPFDFDFSGLVDAEYAGPPPALPLNNNRQRLYRGFCHLGLDWDALFRKFQDRRMQVLELVESVPGLSERTRRTALKYMKDFYKILDSPKKRQKKIVDACRMPAG
jgi:hypothetical protein